LRVVGLTRPLAGEEQNGDGYLLASMDRDRTVEDVVVSDPLNPRSSAGPGSIELDENHLALMAVVDGVGHGPEAAEIASRVLECLRDLLELELVALVRECHEAASQTRGATLGLALLHLPESRLHYIGVGDVALRIISRSTSRTGGGVVRLPGPALDPELSMQTMINNNGTLGYKIPDRLQATSCEYRKGDTILLSSDGIGLEGDPGRLARICKLEAGTMAASLVSAWGSDRDDATQVVAR